MSHILNLPNRVTLGIGAFALLALAAGATTLAARPSQAAGLAPADVCAAQAADTTPETPGAPDTDTADVQCGDQTTPDAAGTEGAEAPESTKPDSDTSQTEVGDQTATDAAGTLN